jgi:hypothetical protein
VVGGGRGADGSSHHLITYKDDIYVGQFVIQFHFYEFINIFLSTRDTWWAI